MTVECGASPHGTRPEVPSEFGIKCARITWPRVTGESTSVSAFRWWRGNSIQLGKPPPKSLIFFISALEQLSVTFWRFRSASAHHLEWPDLMQLDRPGFVMETRSRGSPISHIDVLARVGFIIGSSLNCCDADCTYGFAFLSGKT